MRKIELIGTICKKPEMRTTQTGKDVCSFDIAVYVNPEKSDFYRISAWGKQGEKDHAAAVQRRCAESSISAKNAFWEIGHNAERTAAI